ncbi:MAG: YkgJ family cysteine cluster protein [Candidatus Bathyarchaeia archaeon]
MRCFRCGVCCRNTEMLLSNADIERLEWKGYSKNYFARFCRNGYAVLQNKHGYCVFYDIEKQRCTVYADRPIGCRIYPVIFDETKGIIVDEICCARNTLTSEEIVRKGKKVLKFLEKIDIEAKKRCIK